MRNLLFYLCYFYYIILVKTTKIKFVGFESVLSMWNNKENGVFCCAHNSLLALFVGIDRYPRPKTAVLTSLSKDGELIARILMKRGYTLIRGSSNRGGNKALLELQKLGHSGVSLGLAFDGPKGPPLIPKRGLVACARTVNGKIFLIHAHPNKSPFFNLFRPFRVRSWDKMLIPIPFSYLTVYFELLPSQEEVQISNQDEYEKFILETIEAQSKKVFKGLY